MAKSKFEYVKQFELDDKILPHCYILVRIDGRCFHKFTNDHQFERPNDGRGLKLMNKCANEIMKAHPEIELAYGTSDEFSFVLGRLSDLFSRRASKLQTTFVSKFTACYVFYWKEFFPTLQLQYPPSFDGRCVAYPSRETMRDYLNWRQADCHINNLYNTCFWTIVLKGKKTLTEAEAIVRGTNAGQKHEIMMMQYNLNYNNEPAIFRKGSVLLQDLEEVNVIDSRDGKEIKKQVRVVQTLHCDIIQNDFWNKYEKVLK